MEVCMKIRWGILSTARIAREKVIPAIGASRNGLVAAIASRDAARAADVARMLNIPRAYGSYEELLRDPAIDAIYNPLPTGMHAEWSMRCAAAGKPTLCEKPLASTAAEARTMIAAFAARSVPLAEALMYRFHPLTRRVHTLLADGAVGTPHIIRATFHCAPTRAGNFRFSDGAGGGAVRDLGCYCISVIRHLAGEEPCDVRALGWCAPATGIDECAAGVLRFPTGTLGLFSCSLRSAFDCSYEICGDAGRILVDKGGMVAWPGTAFVIKHWRGDHYQELEIPPANQYQLMVEDFADALLLQRAPAFALDDTLRIQEIMDTVLNLTGSGIELQLNSLPGSWRS
jgi:predicted dehydrogenase